LILSAMAGRHQAESDRMATATEYVLLDLFFRMGEEHNITDWTGAAELRLEAAASAYADLTTSYLDAQMAVLSPDPPLMPNADLSWVPDDLNEWLPSTMVEVNARVGRGEDLNAVLSDVGPTVTRQTTAFMNEVEARTVEQALANTPEFLAFDSERPADITGIDVQGGIAAAEAYANAGYPVTKTSGRHVQIQILPQAGACGFCEIRADRLYSTAVLHGDQIRSHNYCRCDWRVVSPTESQTWQPVMGGGEWQKVIDRRSQPNPNVPSEGIEPT
jgi:hypothetical protein